MAEFIQIDLGAGPDHRNQLKYSELKASDVSPEAKVDRTGGTGSGGQQDEVQESWSCRRCQERFVGPRGTGGRTLPSR